MSNWTLVSDRSGTNQNAAFCPCTEEVDHKKVAQTEKDRTHYNPNYMYMFVSNMNYMT
jgi:hypothetical protein